MMGEHEVGNSMQTMADKYRFTMFSISRGGAKLKKPNRTSHGESSQSGFLENTIHDRCGKKQTEKMVFSHSLWVSGLTRDTFLFERP